MEVLSKIYKEINNNSRYFSVYQNFDIETYKRFSELSIFFELTFDFCGVEYEEDKSTLKKFLISEINSLSENNIFKNIYSSYHIAVPYVSIRKHNKIEKFEKYVKIVSKYKLFPPETPPHRTMEWDYFLYKLDPKYVIPIPQNSILRQDFYPQFFDRDLAYSLTHALFYLMDFGFSTQKPQLVNLEKLKFQLESLIAKFYENNDIDVLLELGINYFSLLPYLELDYDILIILNDALIKTNFIEFNWKTEILEKKYHSFFVLGILTALIKKHLSSTIVSNAKRSMLLSKIKNTIFECVHDVNYRILTEEDIKSLSIMKSWAFLKKIKNKI